MPLLDKFQIDDVVGAIPVHLFAGIWGTLAVAIHTRAETEDGVSFSFIEQLWVQFFSLAVVGIFVFGLSLVLWTVLKTLVGIRVSEEAELQGLDTAELGMEAYPDFGKGAQTIS